MYPTNMAIRRCPPPIIAVVLMYSLARKCFVLVTAECGEVRYFASCVLRAGCRKSSET